MAGHPECILELTEPGQIPGQLSSMRFNSRKAESILSLAEGHPFAILSITGEARQGKSYFLSCLIKYLQCIETSQEPTIQLNNSKEFFHFENGTERMTLGVWMWSRPFKLTRGDGSPYYLFIMDSQGLFDKWTGPREWSGLAGFTLLASSCLIYNTVHSLAENILQLFASFCESATLPLTQDEKEIESTFFQKLVFLIRDWGFPDTHDYGTETGQSYISWRLSTDIHQARNASKPALEARRLVRKGFTDINCCLLPPPGEAAKETKFQGRLNELAPKFKDKLIDFIEDLLIMDGIPIKNGIRSNQRMQIEEFISLISRYVDAYNANETLSPESMVNINIQASNEAAVQICLNQYRKEMANDVELQDIQSLEELQKIQEQLVASAISKFHTIKKFGSPEIKQGYETTLKNKMKHSFITIKNKYQNSESAKLSKIKIAIKEQFQNDLGRIMETIDLDNCIQLFDKLENKYLSALEEALKLNKINIKPEDDISMKEYFSAQIEEATQTIVDVQSQVDSSLDQSFSEFETKFEQRLSNLRISHGEQVPANILNHAAQEVTTKIGRGLTEDLTQQNLSPQDIEKAQAKFRNIATQKVMELQNHASEKEREILKLIEQSVTDHLNKSKQFRNKTFFKETNQIDEEFGNHFKHFHLSIKEEAIQHFEEIVLITNALTLTKYMQILSSKLEKQFKEIESEAEKVRSSFIKFVDLNKKAYCHDLRHKIDSIEPGTDINPNSDRFETFSRQQLQGLQTKLELELSRFPSFDFQIVEILKGFEQDWKLIRNQLTAEQHIYIRNQENVCTTALQEAISSYDHNFDHSVINSHDDLTNQHDSAVTSAITYFNKAAASISATMRVKGEQTLQEQLKQKFTTISEEFTNSTTTKRTNMNKERRKIVADFENKLEHTFPACSATTGKITIFSTDQIRNFSTMEFGKARLALRNYTSSTGSNEKLSAEFENQMEKEFIIVTDGKIMENTNNERTFNTLLQSSISAAINTLEDQGAFSEHDRQQKVVQETVNLVNLGNYLIDEDHIRKVAAEQLSQHFSQQHRNSTTHVGPHNSAPAFDIPMDRTSGDGCSAMEVDDDDNAVQPPKPAPRTKPQPKEGQPPKLNPEKEIAEILKTFCDNFTKQNLAQADDKKLVLAKDAIVDSFSKKLSSSSIDKVDEWSAKLDQTLTQKTKELISNARKEQERQKLVDDDKANSAFAFYKAELDKHCGNSQESSQFLTPEEINLFHVKAKEQTLLKFTNLTKAHTTQLAFLIEAHFAQVCLQQGKNSAMDPAIGIDLGTTFSCVAIFWEGQMTVLPNSQGKRTTPSYVAFKEDGSQLVGEPAKTQAFLDPVNTIFDAKRLIGRSFEDEKVQEDIAHWPFKVVQELGKPKIEVFGNTYHPEQIGAKVLVELKKSAEKFLKRKVTNAVITVPAYFNDGQRQATRDAGAMAGLNVIRIINEPTAAAFAYSLERANTPGSKNILIYDFGGGTFDISILNVNRSQIRALAVNGDTHLGGEDIDSNIVTHCVQQFKTLHKVDLFEGRDDDSDPMLLAKVQRRIRRLRHICEQAKIALSDATTTHINLARIYEDLDLDVDLTRDVFESINAHLFEKSMVLVEKALKECKLSKEKIDEIVLVGGTTRIPKIKEMLTSYFGKPLNNTVNVDEVVACGAALQAALLTGNLDAQIKSKKLNLGHAHRALVEMKISDVQPYSTGVELLDGRMSVIIPKNSPVPTKRTETYLTAYDNQTSVLIVIYEGEEPTAVANHKVGEFYLNGVPPAKAGEQNIEVTMAIDNEGITHVTAVCDTSGAVQDLTVREHKGRISAAEKRALVEIVE